MVTIYMLIDPRNNMPFYVGATTTPLKRRLNCHLMMAKESLTKRRRFTSKFLLSQEKNSLINELLANGLRPVIKGIEQVLPELANETEEKHYNSLLNLGHKLLQYPNRFLHQKKKDYEGKKV